MVFSCCALAEARRQPAPLMRSYNGAKRAPQPNTRAPAAYDGTCCYAPQQVRAEAVFAREAPRCLYARFAGATS